MKQGLVLAVALFVFSPFAPVAGQDVTMQVLDDSGDVDAVLRALRDARSAASSEEGEEASGRRRANVPAGAESSEPGVRVRIDEGLTANLDREEESEGEIEDFDVPEDLVIPGPP